MRLLRLSLFVGVMSAKNRVREFAKRLRTPRYILSLIVSIGYFGFILTRNRVGSFMVRESHLMPETGLVLLSIAMLALLILPWASPSSGPGLVFQDAELNALLAGPVSRRELLLYRLGRNAPQLLFTTLMMWLFAARGGRFAGLLLVILFFEIYFTLVKMARARLRLLRIGFFVRAPVVLGLAAGAVYRAFNALDFRAIGRHFRDTSRAPSQLVEITALGDWFGPLLWLPRAMVDLVYGSWSAFPLAAALVLATACGFFFLASQLDVAFEEASIDVSRKKLEKTLVNNRGLSGTKVMFKRLRPPFDLKSTGHPAMAIFWKNLIAGGRLFSARALALFALPLAFSILLPLIDRESDEILISSAIIAMVGFFMLFVLGPLMFRNDLRSDVSRLDILKSFPLTGNSIVAAEVAAPAVILVFTQTFLLLTAVFHLFPTLEGSRVQLLWWAVAAFVLATPIVTAQVVFQNAVIILLPGFSQSSEGRGFAQSGQHIMVMLLNLLASLFISLPPMLVGLPLWWLLARFMPLPRAAAFASPAVMVILAFEIVIAVRLLGNQLDKIDVADEIPLSI